MGLRLSAKYTNPYVRTYFNTKTGFVNSDSLNVSIKTSTTIHNQVRKSEMVLSRNEKVVLHNHDFLCLLHKGKLGHNKMRTVFKSTFQSKVVLTAILTISPPKRPKNNSSTRRLNKYFLLLRFQVVNPQKTPLVVVVHYRTRPQGPYYVLQCLTSLFAVIH